MKYEDFEVGRGYLLDGTKMTLVSKTEGGEEFSLCFAAGGSNYNFYLEKGQSVSGFKLYEEFEAGKFYKDSDPSGDFKHLILFCTEVKSNKLIGYGINAAGDWSENLEWFGGCLEYAVEATEEEWVEALSKLAVKKGLIEGTRFISPSGKDRGYTLSEGGRYSWEKSFGDFVWSDKGQESGVGKILMSDGDWAKPIKTFEEGKLYESELGAMYRCTKVEDGKVYAYGFSAIGIWFDERVIQSPIEYLKDGDVDKWKKFYRKEANKRYSVGDIVVCLSNGEMYEISDLYADYPRGCKVFYTVRDPLHCSSTKSVNIELSREGEWAEVVKTRGEIEALASLLGYTYTGRTSFALSELYQEEAIDKILKPSTLELTLEEIAEKFGVNVDQIKIKSK